MRHAAFTMYELEREIDVELFQIKYRKLINFESRCMKKRAKIHLVGDILLHIHEQYNNKYTCYLRQITAIATNWVCEGFICVNQIL